VIEPAVGDTTGSPRGRSGVPALTSAVVLLFGADRGSRRTSAAGLPRRWCGRRVGWPGTGPTSQQQRSTARGDQRRGDNAVSHPAIWGTFAEVGGSSVSPLKALVTPQSAQRRSRRWRERRPCRRVPRSVLASLWRSVRRRRSQVGARWRRGSVRR
jgi:hypothetical protein